MDFEFLTDVTGQPLAKCDIECELFGDWLSHDMGTDRSSIKSLLCRIQQMLRKQSVSLEYTGKIYHLSVADDEVELFLNNAELTTDEFDSESVAGPVAGCGLVEFAHLLASWLDFIA